jgi:hypothetical protein
MASDAANRSSGTGTPRLMYDDGTSG